MGMIWAILRQRCPRCRKGRIFKGLLAMEERCPVCGLVYQRDYGYFYGAMYASYFIGFVSTLYWIPMLIMGVNPILVVLLPAIQLVIQVPLTFRYSRVIWLYVDHGFDPEVLEEPARTGDERGNHRVIS